MQIAHLFLSLFPNKQNMISKAKTGKLLSKNFIFLERDWVPKVEQNPSYFARWKQTHRLLPTYGLLT